VTPDRRPNRVWGNRRCPRPTCKNASPANSLDQSKQRPHSQLKDMHPPQSQPSTLACLGIQPANISCCIQQRRLSQEQTLRGADGSAECHQLGTQTSQSAGTTVRGPCLVELDSVFMVGAMCAGGRSCGALLSRTRGPVLCVACRALSVLLWSSR